MQKQCQLQDTMKSYLFVTGLGLVAGILTRLTDFFPADTLWSWSSIATLFGFWIVTVTFLIYFSSSNKSAALNACCYLLAMSFSFYLLQYLLGLFLPRFAGSFKSDLFFFYVCFSLLCGAIAYVLYFWHKNRAWSAILFALPVGGLAAETIGIGLYLCQHGIFLFQLLFDGISLLVLGGFFYRQVSHKMIYLATTVLIAFLGYVLFYRPFL